MAKRRPEPTPEDMKKELGYDPHSLTYPSEISKRFYSDLRPVPDSADERMKREFEELQKEKHMKKNIHLSNGSCCNFEKEQTISYDNQTVVLRQISHAGFHQYLVDLCYNTGLTIPLLFTKEEACRTQSVAKLQIKELHTPSSAFFKLPREIRDKIYTFALSTGTWNTDDIGSFNRVTLAGSIGDPSGFYFPLSKTLGPIITSKHMRQEALPLSYRNTMFNFDDMDDILMLLIAIGETGRQNVTSLSFPWVSRSDLELKWEENPESDNHFLTLPSLHAMRCVQLLKMCKRLGFLRIHFERDLLETITPETFKSDPAIQELRSLQIERVEIWSLDNELLDQCSLACWLKGGMEHSSTLESHGESSTEN